MKTRKAAFFRWPFASLWAFLWLTMSLYPAGAETAKPSVAQLPTIAPVFSLPTWSENKNPAPWQSADALGEASIFLLLLGKDIAASEARALIEAPHALGTRELSSNTLSLAASMGGFPFQFVIASPDPQLLQRLDAARAGSAPAHQAGSTPGAKPVVLLRDEKSIVRRDFGLQTRFGIAPSQSALLVIDRAGWLRRVQAVSSVTQLTFLLQDMDDPTPPLIVGQSTPVFALSDMNGTMPRPADLRGKQYLLLTFFPKCFTGTCTKQLESLRDSWPDLQRNDIAVWGVSVDEADGEKGQRAFAQFLKLPFLLLPDTGRRLSMLYGAANSPNQSAARMSVLIDKNSIVRWIDKQINPTTHGEDVLAKVRALSTQSTAPVPAE